MKHFPRPPLARLAAAIQGALCAGLAFGPPAHAAAPVFGSPAWMAQRGAAPNALPGAETRPAAPSAGVAGAVSTPQQALARAQRSIGDLARAAQAITQAQAAQSAARQLALIQPNPSDVAEGLAPNGLQVATGVPRKLSNPLAGEDPSLWQNAALPTQAVAAGHTTVTVRQKAAKAILTWNKFNVGRDTTLHFDQRQGKQSDGSNEWVVLNRVDDPGAKPSRILGEIKAEGSVYVIDRNGIVFGGASQVNTHSLIASSLSFLGDDKDLGRSNRQFLERGILPDGTTASAVLGLGSDPIEQSDYKPGGDIRVEAGARIRTGDSGFSLLAAPQVRNAGTIEAARGQVILAAGIGVQLSGSNVVNASSTSTNPTGVLSVTLTGSVNKDGANVTPVSVLTQTGLIQSDRGNVTLAGSRVDQLGVVAASTSLTRPGSIIVRASDAGDQRVGRVRFGRDSVTTVLPLDDGSTTTSGASSDGAFKTGSVSVFGGAVDVGALALIEAPGANVSFSAVTDSKAVLISALAGAVNGRVYVDHDATIDVAGLADVELSASASRVTIDRIGQNELADAPLQRLGLLFGQRNVVIDASITGTREDGLSWVGSPVLNAQGYVDLVPRRIDQLLVKGGHLGFVADEAVVTRSGSLLNLDGGYVDYLPGQVAGTTRLLGADGKVYDIGAARTDIDYVGIAGSYDVAHSRWNRTDHYVDPLVSGKGTTYDPGHVAGAQAGTLSLKAGVSSLIEGDVSARATAGRDQVAAAALPAGGTLSVVASGLQGSVVFRTARPDLEAIVGGRFAAATSLATEAQLAKADGDPSKVLVWTPLSTAQIDAAGFSTINVDEVIAIPTGGVVPATQSVLVARGATLAVAPGGAVNVLVGAVRVEGTVSAPSGSVDLATVLGATLSTPELPTRGGDITLTPGARISTAGTWVNDAGLAANDRTGSAGVDGGSIRLTTDIGRIELAKGSLLDVSGGGYVDADGIPRQSGGVLAGRAGSVALQNYSDSGGGIVPTRTDDRTGITLAGQVKSGGFGAGGSFTLQALELQIGGDAGAPSPSVTTTRLDPAFFAGQGFVSYALTGVFGATVTAGTSVDVTTRNRLPRLDTLLATPTGSVLAEGVHYRSGRLDDARRPAADVSLGAGNAGTLLVDRGARITTDAGADLALAGGQLTLLGGLVDHGGAVGLTGRGVTNGPGLGSVWLGGESRIDVSGTTLIDPFAAPERLNDGSSVTPRSGRVLDGGSIALRYDGGYVIARGGSVLDVSGSSDRLDLPLETARADGRTTAPRTVWSDAGSIVLQASSGLYVDATLRARGGSGSAAGGSLRVLPSDAAGQGPAATAVVLRASGSALPGGLVPGAPVEPDLLQPSGKLFFSVDRLNDSGIADLAIGRLATGEAASAAVPIVFSGPVTLELPRSISLNAPAYTAVDAGASEPSVLPARGVAVRLSAPYVAIDGYAPRLGNAAAAPTSDGASTLVVDARQIDMGGRFAFDHFANATLSASGDLRLTTEIGGFDDTGAIVAGQLKTAGNLRLEAAQIYPATYNRFAFIASGGLDPLTGEPVATAITIAGNAASARSTAPLSAGGSLLLDATRIVQGGVLRAPGGQIVLGVAAGDATAATAARFDAPEVVATESVTLGATSRTSVSLEGQTVPYGTTVDGVDWRYNPQSRGSVQTTASLTAPPAKQVELSGAAVDLRRGAVVDVSGGGDLQASEWVAGTGGTRNVLARYNTDLSNAGGPVPVPLYADARKIYAILPGRADRVAPVDPSFGASKTPNVDHTTDLPGVGQQITLTRGVGGLAAGTYTLLPAEYATLPGAYRVVQDTGVVDALAGANAVQPDGSYSVAGRFTDALTGSTSARATRFEVQSRDVWQQYSEYRFSSANTYFAGLAARNATAAPPLPRDAGRLSIGASASLGLGATLVARGAKGGAAAQVDIAAPDIQIVAGAATPKLDGYVQIGAGALNAIGAGSLLIGGTRSAGADGVEIVPLARSVVVSNGSGSALAAPEILLVTRGDASGVDPNAANGLRLDPGSVVRASGQAAAGNVATTYLIGHDPNPAASDFVGSPGDGTLLRVSNLGRATVERRQLGDAAGAARLDVRGGATLAGGASLTLDSSGDVVVDPNATLSGQAIDADSSRVSFVSRAADGVGLSGLVIGPKTLAQFAGADAVTLRSRSTLDFIGALDLRFGGDLTLGAGAIRGDFGAGSGTVTLAARRLMLDNALHAAPAAAPTTVATATLALNAATLVFGSAAGTDAATQSVGVDGFGRVVGTATSAVTGAGHAAFDFQGADLTLAAPVLVAGAGADTRLRTTGAVRLASAGGTAPADRPLGGALEFVGGSLHSQAAVLAPSGTVTLHATSGDLVLASGARIDVAGVAQTFFDVTRYTAAGAITLGADRGSVRLGAGSTLDFSGARPADGTAASAGEGGDAGRLDIGAPGQTVTLNVTLRGSAAAGAQGGRFSVDTGGPVDLDALAAALAGSGVDRRIAVHSRSGNLVLSPGQTLAAAEVELVADGGQAAGRPTASDGQVEIGGRIDASGAEGGRITLYGRNGVAVDGQLIAAAHGAGQRGGDVEIGTSAFASGQVDAATGRQVVQAAGSGAITLGAGALIDVSGSGRGGTVSFRLPLQGDGDVALQAAPGARTAGARDVGVEAVGVWSTTDAAGAGAGKHFDGIIDPAGWFDAGGKRVSGTWTDAQGLAADADGNFPDPLLGVRPIDPGRDFFTPDAAAIDTGHRDFYQTTLAHFVQAPGFGFEGRLAGRFRDADGHDVFHARPGIELRNPDAGVRGGDIDVLSDWNLGAGSGESRLTYRYAGQAPVLTLRAAGNLNISASLTDGFYQRGNVLDVASSHEDASAAYFGNVLGFFPGLTDAYASAPADLGSTGRAGEARYYGLYVAYANFLTTSFTSLDGNTPAFLYQQQIDLGSVPVDGTPSAPVAPSDPTKYPQYLSAYKSYIGRIYALYSASGFTALPEFTVLAAPAGVPTASLPADNSASPVRSAANPMPLQSATLMTGPSTRYRLAAGADTGSTDPLAVRAADNSGAARGSVVVDGHVRITLSVQPGGTNGETVFDSLAPTLVRTGTGRIDLAAATDVSLADPLAPGVVYSAGRQLGGAVLDDKVTLAIPQQPSLLLATNGVNQPVDGGDIRIGAGRDLAGHQDLFFPGDGSFNNVIPGAPYAQYWAPWTQTSNTENQTGLNFSGFDQGVLSAGGHIAIAAGRDIVQFSASAPTTYTAVTAAGGTQKLTVHGGGDLSVEAGRDILSGTYFVSKGRGQIVAGGRIGAAFTLGPFDAAPAVSGDVSTLIALQDGQVGVRAGRGVDLGGIYNPDAIFNELYAPIAVSGTNPRSHQTYSDASAVSVASLAGDVRYGSLKTPNILFAFGGADRSAVQDPLGGGSNDARSEPMSLPASLRMDAFAGGMSIERAGLLAGSQARLELLARDTLQIYDDVSWLPTQTTFFGVGAPDAAGFAALPAGSTGAASPVAPVRLYSAAGDVVDGRADVSGVGNGSTLIQQLQVVADRPAQVRAGRDIVGLWFRGQNNAAADLTAVVAGRDLFDAPPANTGQNAAVDIQLGGPGTLLVEAGRNLGPFNRLDDAVAVGLASPVSGIKTIGNTVNPRLPLAGADLVVLYGVAPGVDLKAFEQRYIDPAATPPSGARSYASELIAFVRRQQGSSAPADLGAGDAYTALRAMPDDLQKVFVQQVFLDVLKQTGVRYNDAQSAQFHQYAPGYAAISTLFPSRLGYTANSTGGNNGAETTLTTGDLDLRGSTLQTQAGGNLSLLGPGGQALVGSTAAAGVVTDSITGNVIVGPNQTGILTLRTGSISSFSDRSILLAQSRIFTEQGGDILLWSSNGDVNAGKGAKTSADTPAPLYICTPDNYCRVDAAGQVTGAGIATLQTVTGAPSGSAILVAPRGTVDAGDAGIRVTGNLIIAAQAVANADNVQVAGTSVGVPSGRVDTGALTAASGAAAAAQAQADALATRRPADAAATLITVDVIGFGAPDEEQKKRMHRGQ